MYGFGKGGHKYWWLLIPRSFVAQGVTNIICNVWNTGKITCQYRWAALTGDRPLCDRDQWREPAPFWGRPPGVIPHWGSAHTEQVAPPTATDGCPVLPSSGDIAPLPAAETGDSINSSDSGNAVASRSKVKVQRKRKRINGDSERNVKKKFVKNASPRDASSPPSRIRWWSDLWP